MENIQRPVDVGVKPEDNGRKQSNEDQPDGGPTESQAGAMPGGSEMGHWTTAYARPDATKPETMPKTLSTPQPGEKNHSSRAKV